MRSHVRGFTLMELMIVVAVIGILAAIIYPSYTDYIVRGNRTVAKSALADAATKQEAYFSDRKQYSATLAGLGYPADPFYIGKDGRPNASNTSNAVYRVSITPTTVNNITTAFTITATPVNGQTRDSTKCTTMFIDSTGTKGQSGSLGSDCWTR